jgi:signal transduction histidine kinase
MTKTKQAASSLRTLEEAMLAPERYDWFSSDLIEILPAAVYVCDADGVVVAYNRRAGELWGRTPKPGDTDQKYCGSHKLFRPDGTYLPHSESPMEWVLRTGGMVRDQEAIVERPDGSRVTVLVNISPLLDKDGALIGAVNCFQDLSAQKRAEADRARAENELRLARRELAQVATRTTAAAMTAAIAHEVQQPLTAIVTNANAGLRWLNRPQPDLGRACHILNNIVRDGHRAGEVVQSVKGMFSGDNREGTFVDTNELVRQTIALLHSDLEAASTVVDLELLPELPPVYGHRGQLQQTILNIVTNASDAMRTVSNRTRLLRVKSAVVNPDRIMLSFEDSGTGIDSKNLERVFDPFFTTKPQGMGMGLAICRSILEAHGGNLTVSSGIPHGSVFQIVLPSATHADRSTWHDTGTIPLHAEATLSRS